MPNTAGKLPASHMTNLATRQDPRTKMPWADGDSPASTLNEPGDPPWSADNAIDGN